MMKIATTRFGTLDIPCDELFLFPGGLIGMEKRRQWALLPDPENTAVAWLQSTTRGELALPVVSPRAFAPEYRAKIAQRDLTLLRLRPGDSTFIVTTLSIGEVETTTNLRAPIVMNMNTRLGAQLVTTDEQPIRQRIDVGLASLGRQAA